MKKTLLFIIAISAIFLTNAQNLRFYVDADATAGQNNGLSWANAFTTLQEAVDSANAAAPTGIAEIWVAEGTYQPTNQTTPFTLQRNIHIYGGFDGTEAILENRDFKNNLSIIDGDLNGDDNSNITVSEATRSDNAYNLFKIEGFFVVLDGLVLQGANGSNNQTSSRWFFDGAAIFYDLDARSGEVRNCVVRNNSAIGSISFSWAGSNTSGNSGSGRFTRNEFYNNYSGGTLFRFTCISSASLANPPNHTTSFQNNLIHGNTLQAWVTGSETSILWLNSAYFNSNNYSGASYFQDISQNTFANNTLPATNSSIIRHFQQTSNPSTANGSQFLFITDNIFSQNGGINVMYWDTVAQDKRNAQAVFWRNLIEDGDSVTAADLGSFNPNIFGNIYDVAPGFTDAANDDYTIIGCDKPGNDRGGSWIITSPSATDFYGNPREVGIGADIGHAEIQEAFTLLDVQQVGDSLVATPGYEPYTWADLSDPQNPIVFTDTTNTFAPPTDSDYSVFAGDANGCGARADIFFCSSVQVSLSIVGDSLVANGTGGTEYIFVYEGNTIQTASGNNTIALQGYGTYEVIHGDVGAICDGVDILQFCGDIPTVSITQNGTILEASVPDADNYQWYLDGTAVAGAITSTLDLTNSPDGDYYVEVSEASCSGTSNTLSYCGSIATPPSIGTNGANLVAPGGFDTYQWALDGNDIVGATSIDYTPTESGDYTVTVGLGGCESTSAAFPYTFTSIKTAQLIDLNVYPNPAKDRVTINTSENLVSIEIYSFNGHLIQSYDASARNLDVSSLAKGIYLLKLNTNEHRSIVKLALQ